MNRGCYDNKLWCLCYTYPNTTIALFSSSVVESGKTNPLFHLYLLFAYLIHSLFLYMHSTTAIRRIEHITHSLKRDTTKVYDLIVVGEGIGGLVAARRAAEVYGLTVALVEHRDKQGNTDCVPREVLLNAASFYEALEHAKDYGYRPQKTTFNWSILKDKQEEYNKHLNDMYTTQCIDLIEGEASFINSTTVKTSSSTIQGKHILISSENQSMVPDIPGSALGITMRELIELEKQPERVAIVGADGDGIELAGLLNVMKSSVIVFSPTTEILDKYDTVIKRNVLQHCQERGVQFVFNSNITSIRLCNIGLIVEFESEGKKTEVMVDALVWTTRSIPTLLNMSVLNMKMKNEREIMVDAYHNTSIPYIYAMGDSTGNRYPTSVAMVNAHRLIDRLFNPQYKHSGLNAHNSPNIIVCPTAVTIGLTEVEAIERYSTEIKVYETQFIGMYYAMTDMKEFTTYKLIVHGKNEHVIGLHMVGRGSVEIMQGFSIALGMGATKADFDSCVAIHPTSAEELVTLH
ncbi:hypothetical protein BDB01DRAFT_791422 [Pilobolus umbonatus]|nr:hypothetical protein BDB01DRAFT_791422 [Pilobolus umbonatus]